MVNGHPRWTNVVRFYPELLDLPLRWQEPRKIFVNSISDVWHPDVNIYLVAQMWAVMALSPWHTYQILTKRPERIRPMLTDPAFYELVRGEMDAIKGKRHRDRRIQHIAIADPGSKPLANIWIGTSVEDQAAADERIPHLLAAPAAVRFLSCEPLLGPLDLYEWLWDAPWASTPSIRTPSHRIDWVIDGGESGIGYRKADMDWFRGIRDQCQAAGVAYWHKQNGGITPKANGKALDGVEHCAFPEVA